jgi:NADP-dependent 3-hydroxy acid dehydrogenase YdfG
MNRLKDKLALTTGTSGIGLETARQFLDGVPASPSPCINPTTIEAARAELGGDILVIRADAGDVTGQTAVAEAVRQASAVSIFCSSMRGS